MIKAAEEAMKAAAKTLSETTNPRIARNAVNSAVTAYQKAGLPCPTDPASPSHNQYLNLMRRCTGLQNNHE